MTSVGVMPGPSMMIVREWSPLGGHRNQVAQGVGTAVGSWLLMNGGALLHPMRAIDGGSLTLASQSLLEPQGLGGAQRAGVPERIEFSIEPCRSLVGAVAAGFLIVEESEAFSHEVVGGVGAHCR